MNHYPTSSSHYDTHPIRQLLLAAFSDEEFTIFCYDFFPAVYREFTIGMTFSAKIQLLLDDCAKTNSFHTLLGLVRKSNPNQYAEFAPSLQPTASTSPLVPTKTLKAIPIEKLGTTVSSRKWPIGWLMLATALTLGWAGYIFYVGLVAPQQTEPLSISFEPILELTSQPAPELPLLPTPISTEELPPEPTFQATVEPTTELALEPTLSVFIEPAFEPTNEPTTPPMTETATEPLQELATELPVEIIAAVMSDLQAESITKLVDEPDEATLEPTTEPIFEPTAEPTDEPAEELNVEPTSEPTEESNVESTEEPNVEPTEEAATEPTDEPTWEEMAYWIGEFSDESMIEPASVP